MAHMVHIACPRDLIKLLLLCWVGWSAIQYNINTQKGLQLHIKLGNAPWSSLSNPLLSWEMPIRRSFISYIEKHSYSQFVSFGSRFQFFSKVYQNLVTISFFLYFLFSLFLLCKGTLLDDDYDEILNCNDSKYDTYEIFNTFFIHSF
jgi:hypothetical protein